ACCAQLVVSKAMRPERHHVRIKAGAIEVRSNFGHVALDAALIELAHRDQHFYRGLRHSLNFGNRSAGRGGHYEWRATASRVLESGVDVRSIGRAGFPTTVDPAGTGRVTTEPAPTVTPSPSGAMMMAPSPIQQSAPMAVPAVTPSLRVPSALR